jgi:hypothetical protein
MESTLRAQSSFTMERPATQVHGPIGLSQQQMQEFAQSHIAALVMEQAIAI